MNKVKEFIKWAKKNSWDIKEKKTELNLNSKIIKRYRNIPKEYIEFLNNIGQCVSPNDTSWLLCEGEYNGTSDIEFSWDEFECISLEAAEDDNDMLFSISNFWNDHLPILMSVNNEYSFYALNIHNQAIVYGYEPEFEEVKIIANSFFDFLDMIMKGKIEL